MTEWKKSTHTMKSSRLSLRNCHVTALTISPAPFTFQNGHVDQSAFADKVHLNWRGTGRLIQQYAAALVTSFLPQVVSHQPSWSIPHANEQPKVTGYPLNKRQYPKLSLTNQVLPDDGCAVSCDTQECLLKSCTDYNTRLSDNK